MMKKILSQIKKLKRSQPIIVECVDAADDDPSPTGLVWKSLNESLKDLREVHIKTVGFFNVYRGKTVFLFTNVEYSNPKDPHIAAEGQIPVGCIQSITLLKEEK